MAKEKVQGQEGFHPEGFTEEQEKLCFRLSNAIQFKGSRIGAIHRRYSEAPLWPVSIDLTILQRMPYVKHLAINQYELSASNLKFDFISPISIRTIHLAASLADRFDVGILTPRPQLADAVRIDGMLGSDKGATTLVVRDIVATEDVVLRAINDLKAGGLKVKDVVTIIDQELGGKQKLAEKGYTLHSVFSLDSMITYYHRMGRIGNDEFDKIKQQMQTLRAFLSAQK